MASSPRRKFLVRQPVVVDVGCGCRRRSKLSSLFFSSSSPSSSSSLKPKVPKSPTSSSSTSAASPTTSHWGSSHAATTTSDRSPLLSPAKMPARSGRRREMKKGAVAESVAVVKESSDPYLDFRDSMMVMIVEKEIYSWDEMRELLRRFVSLNSPEHHHLILRAFAEICHAIYSPAGGDGWEASKR
ncbi:hypothetical protein AXF42_Ash005716 [Apostasia shenzhenica]|uniref:Transcription repressor n=1 Tax=Apostasia shenzhenica TaxID=1088818 RepID=A0A2I0BC77_9ASPA|nr:hypothetical protein AXF42_Ash005716 [Apostasia shenzhenica]